MVQSEYDLIVVGCGIAGLSAAASAIECGLSVAILERSNKEEFGGNTRYTEANMRMKSVDEVSDDFEESFAANAGLNLNPFLLRELSGPPDNWSAITRSHPLPDPEIVQTLSSNAGPTLRWLESFGITFDDSPARLLLTVSAPRIRPNGGGLALIEALSAFAHEKGASFHYETTALRLLSGPAGEVRGVVVRNHDGDLENLNGRGVVIASGGFQGNSAMLTQYLGSRASVIRPVARGGYYDQGEGIRMALDIGAAPAGEYGSYHAEPVDPRSERANACVYCYPYGVLVNKRGKRFVNEAPGPVDNNYDHISRMIADQPDGMAFAIYDSRIEDVPNWTRSIHSEHPPITAPSLDELAAKLGIEPEELNQTVTVYNSACVGNGFKPLEVDGLSTQGIYPPKSNWSRRIDKAPFGAFPVISANCFTFGGLKVNRRAQVLDTDGKIVKGLYAAGETMGLYHQVYTGATSVLRGAVFGRIAGATHGAISKVEAG